MVGTIMKPYYQDEWVTIYHGDCREILPSLEKVDLVFTDPPFNIGKDYGEAVNDNLPIEEYYQWCEEWISQCFDLLVSTGSFYLMNSQTRIGRCQVIMDKHGLFHNLIVWRHYEAAQKDRLLRQHQDILFYSKSKDFKFDPYAQLKPRDMERDWLFKTQYRREDGDRIGDIWDDIKQLQGGACMSNEAITIGLDATKKAHRQQMPEHLAVRGILFSTDKEALVLDPFLGSGTTCYCAKKLNRKSIGIEISEKYCEIAAKRCSQSGMELNIDS